MLDSEHHMESDGYLRQCSHHAPRDRQTAIITRSVMATYGDAIITLRVMLDGEHHAERDGYLGA